MSSKTKSLIAIAVLACAACCTIPIMVALGIAGAAGAVTAAVSGLGLDKIACIGLLGALLAATMYFAIRRFRRSKQEAASCNTSCRVDGACCDGEMKRDD